MIKLKGKGDVMNILCYGDSNTWGYIPNINGYSKDAIIRHYDEKDCWWYSLKNHNKLIVNGLCGRCIAHENRWLKNRNASATINSEISQYTNLDLIILQLGTNDCKSEYEDSPDVITKNLDMLLKIIQKHICVKIMIISPSKIIENNKITQKYYKGAQSKTIQLDSCYKRLAKQRDFLFISGLNLDVGEDGEHLTKLGHKQLGLQVLSKVKELSPAELI